MFVAVKLIALGHFSIFREPGLGSHIVPRGQSLGDDSKVPGLISKLFWQIKKLIRIGICIALEDLLVKIFFCPLHMILHLTLGIE